MEPHHQLQNQNWNRRKKKNKKLDVEMSQAKQSNPNQQQKHNSIQHHKTGPPSTAPQDYPKVIQASRYSDQRQQSNLGLYTIWSWIILVFFVFAYIH